MNKKFIAHIFLSVLVISCSRKEFVPENGDLVFCVAGTSAASQAIVSATAQRDSIKYDHVGLIEVNNNQIFVIEATGKYGVVRTMWNEFLESSPSVDGKPGVTVKRITAVKDAGLYKTLADKAVRRASDFIGQEYDWYYLPDNGKLYCSELVYEAWRDMAGKPMFSSRPMNFRDINGNMPRYWTDLYARLGEPVPEGVKGTNPNDMSKSRILEEVHRFF